MQIDATQPNTLKLRSRHGELVSGITVHVAGHLDGRGMISVNDGPPHELTGAVDWKINESLDGSRCEVQYIPGDVQTGQLTVSYFFH